VLGPPAAGSLSVFCKQYGTFIVLVYVVSVVMLMPCPIRKLLVHRICSIASSMATNSASVELFVFSFCLHDVEYVAPFTSDMTIPM